jgi:hypothetical protein
VLEVHRRALQRRVAVSQTADLESVMTELHVGTKMIESATYDRSAMLLVVQFRTWHVEQFIDVPESIVSAWRISEAPDDFFDSKIRFRFGRRTMTQIKVAGDG